MRTAVEETAIEAILAVMNTTELVVQIRPEKNLSRTGFEPTADLLKFPFLVSSTTL